MNKGKWQALNESWFTEHVFPSLPFQLTSNAGKDVQQMNKIQSCAENKRGTMADQRSWQTVGRQKADRIVVLITAGSGSDSLNSKEQKGHDGHSSWGGEGSEHAEGDEMGLLAPIHTSARGTKLPKRYWCSRLKHPKPKLISDHAPFTLTKIIVSLLALSFGDRVCSTAEEVHTSSLLYHLDCPLMNMDSPGSPGTWRRNKQHKKKGQDV